MTSKHTPGPWSVSKNMQGVFGASRGNGLEPIGYVFYRPGADKHSEVVRRANADVRLIAAAPELLEAAMAFIAPFDGIEVVAGSDIAKARAAIAKATGEGA